MTRKTRFLIGCVFHLLIATGNAESVLPWMLVSMENESRDAEMIVCDEEFERLRVKGVNESKALTQKVILVNTPVKDLLNASCPFGVLHFDSIKPAEFTTEEKKILKEYFRRGGFLLFLEDTYPYEQELFRQKRDLPVYDFITKELPAQSPDFTREVATDEHAIFSAFFKTKTDPGIEMERAENPNYRGRTMLLHQGRIVAFFMGQYPYRDGKRWSPMSRPFHPYEGSRPGFELTVNLYMYSMTH